MRILIDARKIADYGIGTYIRGIGAACARLAPEHEFVFLGDPADGARWALSGDNIKWVHNSSPKYGARELLTLSWQALGQRANLFHAPHYVYPVMLPCPGVVTIHDCIHLRFPKQLQSKLAPSYARFMLRRAVRSAARILTGSEATRSDLVELVQAEPSKIEVIPYGCDDFFFEKVSAEELRQARQQHRLEQRFLLYVGNVKRHKNIDRLLAAFGRVVAGHRDVELVLVGAEAGASEPISSRSQELDLEDRVRILGYVPRERLRALYTLAEAFVFPSLYEGFGLPPLEAMACGTPVVAGRSSSLPEVVGHAGLLVNPRKVDAIADAISLLLDHDELRVALGRRGREQARSFTWDRTAERTLEVYERIAGR